MSEDDLPFPLNGSIVITGTSGTGKTRLTARALEIWLETNGPEGVVVLDLGPEVRRGDRVLGRRLDRFIDLPEEVWVGRVKTRGPRAEGETEEEAMELARANARLAADALEEAPPNPRAVFINDITLAAHAPSNPLDELLAYGDRATLVVVNAYEGTELGVDDPSSRNERSALAVLKRWADRSVVLEQRPEG